MHPISGSSLHRFNASIDFVSSSGLNAFSLSGRLKTNVATRSETSVNITSSLIVMFSSSNSLSESVVHRDRVDAIAGAYLLYDIDPVDDSPKDRVVHVEKRRRSKRDVELARGAVRLLRARHRERAGVAVFEVIRDFELDAPLASGRGIYEAARPVAQRTATLDHKPWLIAMKGEPVVKTSSYKIDEIS